MSVVACGIEDDLVLGMYAYADRNPRLLGTNVARRAKQPETRIDRAPSVGRRVERDEVTNDLVAHEAVDHRAATAEDVDAGRVEAIDDPVRSGRPELFGKRHGPAHVGEQRRQLDFRAAFPSDQLALAEVAVPRVFRERFPAEQPEQGNERAAEGDRAELAAR